MLILGDNDTVVNSEFITKIYIGGRPEASAIRADISAGGSAEIMRYGKKNISQYVLEMLAIAWAAEEKIFRFPSEREVITMMSAQKGAGIHVKTKETRHGGS